MAANRLSPLVQRGHGAATDRGRIDWRSTREPLPSALFHRPPQRVRCALPVPRAVSRFSARAYRARVDTHRATATGATIGPDTGRTRRLRSRVQALSGCPRLGIGRPPDSDPGAFARRSGSLADPGWLDHVVARPDDPRHAVAVVLARRLPGANRTIRGTKHAGTRLRNLRAQARQTRPSRCGFRDCRCIFLRVGPIQTIGPVLLYTSDAADDLLC